MTVALGDGIAELGWMGRGAAGLVLTDLPSGETQAEFDRKVELQAFWPAAWWALRNDGKVVCLASSMRFAAEVIASQPDAFDYDLVWSKSAATGFLNARKRPLRAHEFILVFSRAPGAYHPQMVTGASPIHAARRKSHGENYGAFVRATDSRAGATDRYPTSVLEFATVGTSDKRRRHPQQKPDPLLSWLIRTYSNPGDLVVDPFAGSGSTGDAALAAGRRFAGWDSSPRFGSPAVSIAQSTAHAQQTHSKEEETA